MTKRSWLETEEEWTRQQYRLHPGLERTLLLILGERIGRENALPRASLLALVRSMPACKTVTDRQLRAAVNQLRKAEHTICSAGGEEGGYWMGASWEEVEEYTRRELHSRAMDLLEQEQAMKRGAEKRWGPQQFTLGV